MGLRPCDLAAVLVRDRVSLESDPAYRSRREAAFLVVVNCGSPAGTCFCASMGTGPRAGPGFDLALTELIDDVRHEILVEAGSERGAAIAATLAHRAAGAADVEAAQAAAREATGRMGRTLRRISSSGGLRLRPGVRGAGGG